LGNDPPEWLIVICASFAADSIIQQGLYFDIDKKELQLIIF